MIIGHLELPNKWATTAMVNNQPFVYRSGPPTIFAPNDAWGNIIKIDPWFKNYKIVSQNGYSITEFWCVNLKDGIHDHLLVPILMKRYCNNDLTYRSFLFKNGIFDLLMETNKNLPDFNRVYIQQYGCAELLFECLSEHPGLFQMWEETLRNLRVSGAFETRFPSGTPFIIDELLRRCVPIELYAKSTVALLNESMDLSELGIIDSFKMRDWFRDSTPINPLTNIVDVDWIGERILIENVTNFSFDDIVQATCSTSNSNNLMTILSDTVKREELINVPNFTQNTILEDYAMSQYGDQSCSKPNSEYVNVLENIDMIINMLILDDVTTYIAEYDMRKPNGMNIIERIYGYGLCSAVSFSNVARPKQPYDLDFACRDLCDQLNAVSIRLIKTYNEELFITITYNSGEVRSYYYNLIVHACVSGCLFSA